MALVITRAIIGISRDFFYWDLGLEFPAHPRWCHKLFLLYKEINAPLIFFQQSSFNYCIECKSKVYQLIKTRLNNFPQESKH